MDMWHWTPRAQRALVSYLNGRNRKGINGVLSQIAADQVNATTLESGPRGATGSH